MKNIKHLLPPLDEVATREAVEAELEKALFYKITDIERKEVKITASYEAQESQRTNVTSDSTANVALHNVTEEEMRERHIFKVERAVSKLNRKQRELINARYLTEFGVYDIDVYHGVMGISAHTYTKIRNEAFWMLAFILKVYVEKDK